MDDEELERTGILQAISKYEEDDSNILEIVEEYEDRIDYLDIDAKEKKEIMNLCEKIKEEKDEEKQEILYYELREIVEK
jgi:hypothetical protein